MLKAHKSRLLLGLALIVAVMLLPPIIFGTPRHIEGQSGGDGWRNFVYDFQTLLTGIFAVGAATWTVWTMEKTDARSEARHRQLVTISLRGELRALERALNPQIDQFSDTFLMLWSAGHDPESQNGNGNWEWYTNLVNTHLGVVEGLQEIIGRPQFADGAPFFDGELSCAYTDFEESVSVVLAGMNAHAEALKAYEEKNYNTFNAYFNFTWEPYSQEIAFSAVDFIGEAARLLANLRRFDAEHRKLQREYGV